MDPFLSTLVKLALPSVACFVILGVARRRGVSWRDDLGLRGAPWVEASVWIASWLVWLGTSELLIRHFGLQQPQPWPGHGPWVLVMRILTIGLVGPFFEELALRGLLFHVLRRSKPGPVGAVVLISAGWAAMHFRYDPGTLGLVFVDGVLLGFARHRSGSLWLPAGMHALGNLISIAQSLAL